jgi:hypothetical protein
LGRHSRFRKVPAVVSVCGKQPELTRNVSLEVDGERGPVLVTVEYRVVDDKNRAAFPAALNRLRRERLRDGAYAWAIFEDTAERGRFLETFLVESWLEHLRQHERVTNTDSVLQQSINGLLKGEPAVTHFIAPSP